MPLLDKFQQSSLDSGWCLSSVPLQLGIAVIQQRQIRTVSNCALWTGLTCPWLHVKVVDISGVAQTHFPWSVFPEILQLQYIDKVIDVCCAGPWCAFIVGDSRDPTVAARFSSGQVVDIPVVFNDRLGVKVQKTVTVPQLQHI